MAPKGGMFRHYSLDDDFESSARGDQLSEWLRVPWTNVFRLSYSGSSVSGPVTDMPSPTATMTFRKLRDTSRLVFQLSGSCYSSAAAEYAYFYVRLNGGDYGIAFSYFNAGSTHLHVSGAVHVDDIPADTYTIQIGWGVVGTLTVNASDPFCLTVTETNAAPDT